MKILKSTIFAALALATVAFTGCTDDDNYSIGDASEGAYFADGTATSVRASNKVTVYEVPVYRTSADAPSTYTITSTVYPETAGISIPSSVSFAGDATTTTLPITYDPSVVDQSQVYDLVLKIDNASSYGKSELDMGFQVAAPLVTVPWDGSVPEGTDSNGNVYPAVEGTCTGTGTYYYTAADWGADAGLPIVKVYDPENPHSYDLVISNWGDGDQTLTINVPDDRVRSKYGHVPVSIGKNVIVAGYYYVTDYATYRADGADYSGYAAFDPEGGEIYFALAYYSIETDKALLIDYDSFQLDGYPDYSISAEYKGLYINPSDEAYAIGLTTTGANVSAVKAAFVQASSESEAYAYVKAGGEGVVDVEPGTEVRTLFPVSGNGTYYLAALAYDGEGTIQDYDIQKAVVNLGDNDDADWTVLGEGEFVDGWFLSGYTSIVPSDYAFPVTIRKHNTTPNLYSMVAPYASDYYVLNVMDYNDCAAKRNIEFTIDGDFVEIYPQLSGLKYEDEDEFAIENYEGFVDSYFITNQSQELTPTQIQTVCTNNDFPWSTYDADDALVTIPECPFTFDGVVDIYFYSTKDDDGNRVQLKNPGYIAFPESSAAARAKARAKLVAKPRISGLRAAIAQSRTFGKDKLKVADQMSKAGVNMKFEVSPRLNLNKK